MQMTQQLFSTMFEKLQLSSEELQAACRKWGMKIIFSKCKIITSSEKCIVLEGEELDPVGEFCFLGSIVPSTQRDVCRYIATSSAAFGRHRNGIFSKRSISTRLKARLCGVLMLLTAIYGTEAWMLRSHEIQPLKVFEMRCLRLLEVLQGRTDYKISKSEKTSLPLNIL